MNMKLAFYREYMIWSYSAVAKYGEMNTSGLSCTILLHFLPKKKHIEAIWNLVNIFTDY